MQCSLWGFTYSLYEGDVMLLQWVCCRSKIVADGAVHQPYFCQHFLGLLKKKSLKVPLRNFVYIFWKLNFSNVSKVDPTFDFISKIHAILAFIWWKYFMPIFAEIWSFQKKFPVFFDGTFQVFFSECSKKW